MTQEMTLETFKELIFDFEKNKEWSYTSDIPCIIDFWAPWCAPCRAVAPIFEELSNVYEGKVQFYKVNTDEQQELSAMFGISSIPSFLFIPVGDHPKMAPGALPRELFVEAIEKELHVTL
ncbi:thiol reductase thioredoxin [Chlorobiota bacterium]|jgi:thioredoxin 1|nr:thiol reductase thioredoxin [Chlorobiota bacterium]